MSVFLNCRCILEEVFDQPNPLLHVSAWSFLLLSRITRKKTTKKAILRPFVSTRVTVTLAIKHWKQLRSHLRLHITALDVDSLQHGSQDEPSDNFGTGGGSVCKTGKKMDEEHGRRPVGLQVELRQALHEANPP